MPGNTGKCGTRANPVETLQQIGVVWRHPALQLHSTKIVFKMWVTQV